MTTDPKNPESAAVTAGGDKPRITRIVRTTLRTDAEAAEDNKVRAQIAAELPELIERHHASFEQ